jgi:hypothetical protein
MNIIPAAQHLIWLQIILIAIVVGYILTRRPIDRGRSISLHVANDPATIRLFAVVSTLAAVPFFIYLLYWLIPALQLPFAFTVLVLLAAACQMIAGWIPHIEGDKKGDIHQLFAYTMAVLMPVVLAFLLFAHTITLAPKIVIGLMIVWMVISLLRYQFVPATRQQYLAYQSAYIASFCIGLLAATYIP